MRRARRVVVKVGTGVLTHEGRLDPEVLASLASQCAALLAAKREVVVVSSGAIALGVEQLGYGERPRTMAGLQACAAAGQGHLIRRWGEAFARHGITVAQVLLTHADLADRQRFLNARRALDELLRRGAVPVINENDTVSVEEIAFGDNDALSAQVANVVGAELLVMLSVAPALLDRERRVDEVHPEDGGAEGLVWAGASAGGKGGMATKVKAARTASALGTGAVIAAGREPGMLERALAGEDVGTFFWPRQERLASRAHWIAHTLRPRGTLVVDDGAVEAVARHGKSLLPSGIVSVLGDFTAGEAVEVAGLGGTVVARGLAAYGADELQRLKGRQSSEVEALLGYHLGDEAIHKDDLVLLEGPATSP
jgi:glutamate 5-kinase